jgi:hypothetical protein
MHANTTPNARHLATPRTMPANPRHDGPVSSRAFPLPHFRPRLATNRLEFGPEGLAGNVKAEEIGNGFITVALPVRRAEHVGLATHRTMECRARRSC